MGMIGVSLLFASLCINIKIQDMKVDVDFLDWLVELDIRHYKTESFPDYTPSGKSHFYIAGSPERFTSKEMIKSDTKLAGM